MAQSAGRGARQLTGRDGCGDSDGRVPTGATVGACFVVVLAHARLPGRGSAAFVPCARGERRSINGCTRGGTLRHGTPYRTVRVDSRGICGVRRWTPASSAGGGRWIDRPPAEWPGPHSGTARQYGTGTPN